MPSLQLSVMVIPNLIPLRYDPNLTSDLISYHTMRYDAVVIRTAAEPMAHTAVI